MIDHWQLCESRYRLIMWYNLQIHKCGLNYTAIILEHLIWLIHKHVTYRIFIPTLRYHIIVSRKMYQRCENMYRTLNKSRRKMKRREKRTISFLSKRMDPRTTYCKDILSPPSATVRKEGWLEWKEKRGGEKRGSPTNNSKVLIKQPAKRRLGWFCKLNRKNVTKSNLREALLAKCANILLFFIYLSQIALSYILPQNHPLFILK